MSLDYNFLKYKETFVARRRHDSLPKAFSTNSVCNNMIKVCSPTQFIFCLKETKHFECREYPFGNFQAG